MTRIAPAASEHGHGLTGHVLVDAIAPQISASESIALVPLAMGSTYIQIGRAHV